MKPSLGLDTSVQYLKGVGPKMVLKLGKLGIGSVWDLLTHYPFRYLNYGLVTSIDKIQEGEVVTLQGEILEINNQYTRGGRQIQKLTLKDNSGELSIVWFNQPFLTRVLRKGSRVALSGKVKSYQGELTLVAPDYETLSKGEKAIHTGRLVPVYPETSGVSSKFLRKIITPLLLEVKEQIPEILPAKTLVDHQLINRKEALVKIHFPENKIASQKARYRLAFEEMLLLQTKIIRKRAKRKKEQNAFVWKIKDKELEKRVGEFIKKLPFALTSSQKKAIKEILNSLKGKSSANHLLCGDVGSGKTIVAAAVFWASLLNGHSVTYMAPTEILAFQHYETLKKLFTPFKIPVELLTGSKKIKKKGRVKIILGTHALLFQKELPDVGLVVVDEQHRFGVKQRKKLLGKNKKGFFAHRLTMTATPIPRTIALSLYGDLDISTLDKMPPGRKKVSTFVIPPKDQEKCHTWLKKEIKGKKIQAFVICPLVEASESLSSVKAVKGEFESLKKVFPKLKLELLHGRLKGKEKETILKKMQKRKIDILVSTPVVEVGLDLPNAAVMIIQSADRFGLAQLHQLRGRVGRGVKKSYCYLFAQDPSQKAIKRLKALTKYQQGLKLARLDLKWRGPGEMLGLKQHGLLKLKLANFTNLKLIKATYLEACKLATK